jgi:hypothetical protein
MKLNEWKKQAGYTLPLKIVARIVGIKNANYLTELWNRGGDDQERVKNYVKDAESRFCDICL